MRTNTEAAGAGRGGGGPSLPRDVVIAGSRERLYLPRERGGGYFE